MNPNKSKQDWNNALKDCVDASLEAIRVTMLSEMEIELNAEDGDSVVAKPDRLSGQCVVTNSSSGVVLNPVASIGIKSVCLFVQNLTDIVSPQELKVEVSPVDEGDFWVRTDICITPSSASGETRMSAVGSICARRVRVSISNPIVSGSVSVMLVGHSV